MESNAASLIRTGLANFAAAPPGNPGHLDFPRYTIPLIAHDYPAKTPAMWNECYRRFGLDAGCVMLVADPAQAASILNTLRQDPAYCGGGAGVGFKEAAIRWLDHLDCAARLAGSVNLVVRGAPGELRGYNTDGEGYCASLEAELLVRGQAMAGRRICLLGAGGTAAAIGASLGRRGARLVIVNRTLTKARDLAQRLNDAYPGAVVEVLPESEMVRAAAHADAVVNTTLKGSAGPLAAFHAMGPGPGPDVMLEENRAAAGRAMVVLPPHAIVSDVIIAHEPTPLLRDAAARGHATLDGTPMVVNQAVESFWIIHETELAGQSKEDVRGVMGEAAARR